MLRVNCFKRWLLPTLTAILWLLSGCGNSSKVSVGEIRISEVMSRNTCYAPLSDGSCCDWVEIQNASSRQVNLKNWSLSDSTGDARKWKVPTDYVIAPGEYGVIYLSGKDTVDEEGYLHASFKLSSKGETLVLCGASGEAEQILTVPACKLRNVSYGLSEEKKQYLWYANPTPGQPNRGSTASSPDELTVPETGVVINEYMTKNTCGLTDGCGDYSDWIELYNGSDEAVSLYGCALGDSDDGAKWFFPKGASLGAGEYLVVFCTDTVSEQPGICHADFRLSEGETIAFYNAAGLVEDAVTAFPLNPNVSCGRDPKSGEFRQFSSPTPGRANTTYSYALTQSVGADPLTSLYISEALCVSDNEGEFDRDYVELHNAGVKAVSLDGYALAKSSEGTRYAFPDVTLGAGEYLIVYCVGDRQDGKSELTAPFRLNQGGEELYLFDGGGRILDVMRTGPQTYGHSSGRIAGRTNQVVVFETPTPGKSNDGVAVYEGYAPAPVLSSEGGYVKAGFALSCDAPADCEIHVTTDGTLPDRSSGRWQTDKPLVIEQNAVVSAVAYRDGCLPSRVTTATFLTETPHTIPVVSVSSPPDGLFSRETGIFSKAVNQLVPGKANYLSDEKREATFEYFIDGQKAVSFRCGLKVAGDYSRRFPQKGMAVIMSERYGVNACYFPFFGAYSPSKTESLLLRPSGQDWLRAHLRDEFCSRIVRASEADDSGVQCDYQEAQPVALYINGEYWGLYYIREKLNEDYLVNRCGYTKGHIDIIKWEGSVQSGSLTEWKALLDFCADNDMQDEANYRYVCDRVDVDSLIDWWVFETYVGNDDTGNVRCCRDQNGGKWHWMLFDLDDAFHLSYYRVNYIKKYAMGSTHGLSGCRNTLIRRMLTNPDFRERFIRRYLYHINTTFDPERLEGLLDELQSEIDPEMSRQYERWGKPSSGFYTYNINAMHRIIKAKPAIARRHLREAFGLTEEELAVYE